MSKNVPEQWDFYFKSSKIIIFRFGFLNNGISILNPSFCCCFCSSGKGDRSVFSASPKTEIVLLKREIVQKSRHLEKPRSFQPIGRSFYFPGIWIFIKSRFKDPPIGGSLFGESGGPNWESKGGERNIRKRTPLQGGVLFQYSVGGLFIEIRDIE